MPSLADRQHAALSKLLALVADRRARAEAIEAAHRAEAEGAEREVARARKSAAAARKKAADDLADAYQSALAGIAARYAQARAESTESRQSLRARTVAHYCGKLQTLRSEQEEKNWTADSLKEAADKEVADQHADFLRQASAAAKHLEGRWAGAALKLARVRLTREAVTFDAARLPSATVTDPVGKLEKCLEDVDRAAERLGRAPADRFLTGGAALGIFAALAAVGAGIGSGLFPQLTTALAITLGVAVGGSLIARGLIAYWSHRQLTDRGNALGVYQAEAERAVAGLRRHAEKTRKHRLAKFAAKHAANKAKVAERYGPKIAASEAALAGKLAAIDAQAESTRRDLAEGQAGEDEEARAAHDSGLRAAEASAERDLAHAAGAFQARTGAADAKRAADWARLQADWHGGVGEVRAECADLASVGAEQFPAWAELVRRPFPTLAPEGVPAGELRVRLADLPGGTSDDPRLSLPEPLDLAMPAFTPFPARACVLLKSGDLERATAVRVLNALMLRALTALPPGKARFTILDPVGLGENFASFMHLADTDEKLVTGRIWTEPAQIEARLTDLTEHMETVIQKYLRNQYKSIEEYNAAAGEVAEPYRVLVVANFPANFTPDAARRLVSIMASGPACGVVTYVSTDRHMPLPRDFRLADLEQLAYTLDLAPGGAVKPADPVLAQFPLTLDEAPAPEVIAPIVKRVAQASVDAARVEVPFEFIMPEAMWQKSSAKGFELPIGRAGATRRQVLTLGKGTAQHALVAGKTGSGKSTLLHAIITNMALTYSPDEAELYLIDFKKGVEFQAYVEAKLPHARVIAVESEREFGLSVLQRLDGVLRERGDRFRDAGVNDLAGYREVLAKQGAGVLARIMLVVDEFQEFFVEDDKLSQEAALLLDRLVRQGRAFGVHVLLGSQTLGGAYSIPRATIDQMAVRVALQCSEADAQLILSKDNSAARLLNRPGEAIYNDANGLVEGNNPFQVVWLNDDRRAELLADVRRRAAGRADRPALVFAGNAAADLALSPAVADSRAAGPPAIYLGDPVAISAPTHAVLRSQSGANLLVLGQHEESALAIATSAILGMTRRGVPVRVIDGTPSDEVHAGYLGRACEAVGSLAESAEPGQLGVLLVELSAELERRQAGGDRKPRLLIVHALHRLRELRKVEDDFGFGRKADRAAPPAQLFATLLRDGPAVGLHTLVWCDSLTNLNRAVDRAGLRDFSLRVLFQMSATDSSQLIDTPAASRLGRNRALLVEEGSERAEKFRPYGMPGLAWLGRLDLAPPVPVAELAAPPA